MFILLFSISCKAKQKPEEHSRAELEGGWEGGISIYDDAIMHTFIGIHGKYKYIGKVDENFYYPYTVNIKRDDYNGVVGTITFNNSTNCIVHYTKEYYDSMISWKLECIDTNYYRNYKKLDEYMENPAE